MSDLDTSSKGLLENLELTEDIVKMSGQSEKKTFFIGESEESCSSDLDEHYQSTGMSPTLSRHTDFYVEKIEDKRLSYQGGLRDECQLRKRTAMSENDISFAGTINKKVSEMRLSFEEELEKKMCKECLFRSIQSKLSMLGIVSTSNGNLDASEETKHIHKSVGVSEEGNDKNENRCSSTLLENLNRRSVSSQPIFILLYL